MTTDSSVTSIRVALQTGGAAAACRVFLTLPKVETDFKDLLVVVLHDPYAQDSISISTSIAFLQGFDSVEWVLAGCGVLHSVHVEKQLSSPYADVPVFQLARFVEDVLATLPGDDARRPRAEMLAKEWFSPTVRAVVRGEKIQIKSLLRKEILYAPANELKFDATHRFVFTWSSAWYDDGARSEQFVAEPVDETWTRFAIRSEPYNEYLVAEIVEDENDQQHASRCRVFSVPVEGHALTNVGEAGVWMLRLRDGTTNRDIFHVCNAHVDQKLQSPGGFFHDSSRRYVTTVSTCGEEDDDELVQTCRWLIEPLLSVPALEHAIETFFQANYSQAESHFLKMMRTYADLDTRFLIRVFILAIRFRQRRIVNEVEFEALEALGGASTADHVGLQDLWAELVAVISQKRLQDAAHHPRAHAERKMRQASHLVATREYQSALEIFIEIVQVAERSLEVVSDDSDRDANQRVSELRRIRDLARLEIVKMRFCLGRIEEALTDLEQLQQNTTLPNELAARALLWSAKCKRQHKCDWEEILKLLRRALDKLAASDTVAVGLRHSIVLEMAVANIAHQGPERSTGSLSAERVIEMCRCPISLEVMADPVVTPSGVSYERELIELHLRTNGMFDPMSHAALNTKQLYPNRMLRQVLEMALAESDPVNVVEDGPARAC